MQPGKEIRPAPIQQLKDGRTDVLRLDLVHPVVSGNKWFKLRFYLEEAIQSGKTCMMSFGGAWSNHIVALAAAASMHGLKSIGLVRGEKAAELSKTLQQAEAYGMRLFFLSRSSYREHDIPAEVWKAVKENEVYIIKEGGYGIKGAAGAATMLDALDLQQYDYILAATGTGTMLAGLATRISPSQKLIGISVLKNNFSITAEINELLPVEKQNAFNILHPYHFGGYARGRQQLFDFMNHWYDTTKIPTDFVYTAKLFYAYEDLAQTGFFPGNARILVIHSGGLQGNASLPNGTLIF